MKKIVIVFFALVAVTVTGNAQFFVEGEAGASFNGGEATDGGISKDIPSFFAFSVSPKMGYWLNDNIAVGAYASVGGTISKDLISDPDNPEKEIEFECKSPISFGTAKYEETGRKVTNNQFGFNTKSSVFNSLTDINVGFIYNF